MIKQGGSGQPKPFAYFTGGIDLSEFKKRKYVIRYSKQYNIHVRRFISNGTERIFSMCTRILHWEYFYVLRTYQFARVP